jgi:hypothetical protein
MNLGWGNNDWQNTYQLGLQQGAIPYLPQPVPLPHVAQGTYNYGAPQAGTHHHQHPLAPTVFPPQEPIPETNANGPPTEPENSAQGQATENGQAPEGGKGKKNNGGSRDFRREA